MNKPDWKQVQIRDIGKVITGRTPSTATPDHFGRDYPFITPSDMDGRRTIMDTARGLSSKGATSLASAKVPANSVCVSCIGWQMGKVIMTGTTSFTNQQINSIVPNDNVVSEFLYYSLSTRRTELKTLASVGTRTPILIKSSFEKVSLEIPSLPTQRKIAALLSAYDDLIENNTRRIKILEEMAQALYREWFVHFRFPGHEGVRLVESELGLVPEGWEVSPLSTVANIVMGQSPESRYYNDSGDGLPFHQGVMDFGDRFPTDRMYTTFNGRIAEAGDILFSVRAPVGRLNITTKTLVIGRGLCAIRSKSNNQTFLFQQLKESFQEEDTMGGGTIFKSVTKDDVRGIKLIWPEGSVIERFERIATPMFAELENLTSRNANLRRTRDLLLPKLISGEVEVK
jgi:type I restriction enzyme S subunit